MGWAHLLAFNAALLAAMAAPGPALLFALRQSIAGGFRTGVATGAGLGLVAAGWTAAALLGLGALFALVPWAYLALKITGALYLMRVAWTLWRDAYAPVADSAHPGARAFLGGVLVNLSNPKSVLFAASVLAVIFPQDMTLADKALIVLDHFVIELCVYTAFAALLAAPPARAGYLRLKPVLDRVAAAVLGALGLRLLLDR
ncbi:LysE family translocator [Salipiger mucosus]|uniref:L-lysine permease n=1 Tax=Salipiger mucosus DSM 16094 TaxID=1123237 RepID=S9QAN0_9RHOB|nr:LysE family transporter [Salipiger mucosus]EPX78431.1 L-lysine permease [Salipiger mucosus DSM 16094]